MMERKNFMSHFIPYNILVLLFHYFITFILLENHANVYNTFLVLKPKQIFLQFNMLCIHYYR